ncbi:hypothetical protein B0H11DRAFT_2069610 [Mycena galericulata]|nr:hypothetical protein B0H11DRAFT_2069610 [Mycena galericulata]
MLVNAHNPPRIVGPLQASSSSSSLPKPFPSRSQALPLVLVSANDILRPLKALYTQALFKLYRAVCPQALIHHPQAFLHRTSQLPLAPRIIQCRLTSPALFVLQRIPCIQVDCGVMFVIVALASTRCSQTARYPIWDDWWMTGGPHDHGLRICVDGRKCTCSFKSCRA